MLSAVAARKAQQQQQQQQPAYGSFGKKKTRSKAPDAQVKPGGSLTSPTPASPEKPDPALKRKRRNDGPKLAEKDRARQSTRRDVTYEPEVVVDVAGPSELPPRAAKKPRRAWSPSQPLAQAGGDSEDLGNEARVSEGDGDDDLLVMNAQPFPSAGGTQSSADQSTLASVLSSFKPKVGENVFPSSIDGSTVVIFALGDTLCFMGTVSLTVLHGSVDLLGTRLTVSSRAHPIFAPRSAPLPVLSCLASAASSTPVSQPISIPQEVLQHIDEGKCALLLRPLVTNVEGLGKVCGTYEGVFGDTDGVDEVFSIPGFRLVYSAANNLHPFTFASEWGAALDEIAPPVISDPSSSTAAMISKPMVAMVKGAKHTGKSTFARTLLNRLCLRYRQVAFLDCDLGQSEFSPGGMVSLHVVSLPVFGPPFTHPQRPYMAHYIGSITPRSAPSQYIVAIAALLHTYRLDLQYTATELDSMELDDEGPDARRSDLIPLVVNTQGWMKGLGADLMRALEEVVQPTHLFEFDDDERPPPPPPPPQSRGNTPFVQSPSKSHRRAAIVNDVPGMTSWADLSWTTSTAFGGDRHATKVYTLPSAPSGPLANYFTPADTRAIGLMSYFHCTHATSPTALWRTNVSLLASPPYVVDVDVAFDAIFLTGPGSEDVVHEEVLRALNCSVVALVEDENSKEAFVDHERDGSRLPYVQGTPPPDPTTSRCHGLAFIRGISTLSQHSSSSGPAVSLHLLTPVPPEALFRCRVLVKGEMEMPIWAFIGSSNDSNGGEEWKGTGKKSESGGGTVCGVPWENVSYLAFRGARESASTVMLTTRGIPAVVGSGVRKARRNVMRRGQM